MANIFNQDPLILDTIWGNTLSPIVATPTALTDGTDYNQTFRRIVWINPTAANDEIKIVDQDGNIIFHSFASVAHKSVVLWDAGASRKSFSFKQGEWSLSVLGSGKLFLYR